MMRSGFRSRIAKDFAAVMDNLEPITVNLRRSVPESVSVTNANRTELTREMEEFGDLTVEEDDLKFAFPCEDFVQTINAAEVLQHDEIVDGAGVTYVVQRVNLSVMQTLWNVAVRRK